MTSPVAHSSESAGDVSEPGSSFVPDATAPRRIGRFHVLRVLKQDRRSVTYLATDPVMNRQVIVKSVNLFDSGAASSDREAKRVEQAFMRQAQAAGALHHPHIVTVFDAGLGQHSGYLVLEKVAGRPLQDILAGGMHMAFVQSASIVARLADAIEFAHQNGICHGQISVSRITLQANGLPKLSGFGGWIDEGQSGDAALADTPARLPYFDNELSPASQQADVRGLGAVLHILLTGQSAPMLVPNNVSQAGSESDRGRLTAAAGKQIPAALARVTDQALLSGYVSDGLTSAAQLRDNLTAFIWNERSHQTSFATVGLPLAPPPQANPVLMATIGPEDNFSAWIDDFPAPTPEPRESLKPDSLKPAAANEPNSHRAIFATIDTPLPPTLETELPPAIAAGEPEPSDELDSGWVKQKLTSLLWAVAFVVGSALIGVIMARFNPQAPTRPVAPTTQLPKDATTPGLSTISFDIRPWGHVIVDGNLQGTTPPLQNIQLPSGVHRIEIQHEPFPVWRADVDVRAPTPVHIEHQFSDAKATP